MKAPARILLVEDNSSVAGTFRGIISGAGYNVDWAQSEQEAMSHLQAKLYNVAFVDLNLTGDDMAHKGGLDVVAYIEKLNEGTKTFVVSGSTDARDVVKSYRSGAVDFIMKSEVRSAKELLEPIEKSIKNQRLELLGKFDRLTAFLAAPDDISIWESKLIETLGEDFKTCEKALSEAFAPLIPVIRKADGSAALSFDRDKKSIGGIFWSKAEGNAIYVSLASKNGQLNPPADGFKVEVIDTVKGKPGGIKLKAWRLPTLGRELFAESIWDEPWKR